MTCARPRPPRHRCQFAAGGAEALRVREHRFTQGLDKMIDLLDAETAAREAELRELVARYDVSLTATGCCSLPAPT